jgi:hypothetical protein
LINILQVAAHENIKVRPSNPNEAAGDCVFESTVDQFLFQYRGRHFPGFTILDHQQLRQLTVETLGPNETARAFGLVDSDLEWQIELGKLLELGIWNTKVADLILPGIAFTLKKNILIFYTDVTLSDRPIRVFTPGFLGGEADCNVPLVFCYNGNHYEGSIPETVEDELKCHGLVELWESGRYLTKMQDIPALWDQLSFAVRGSS